MTLSARQAVEVLRAAGEPTRMRILALLAREELAVMELSQILDQSQPRVSRHLKLLTEAELVEMSDVRRLLEWLRPERRWTLIKKP